MSINSLIRSTLPFISVALGLFCSSCAEYQAILKSHDNELWYQKGMEYYAAKDYDKAANLLGGVLTHYAGTARYDTVITTYAYSLVELADYYSAAHYFSDYVKTFPSSSKCKDCQFMAGLCYYRLSPKVELDQKDTQSAIEELLLYINLYPDADRVDEAEKMIREMEDKLAYKAYLSAKLYFDLGNYMGNNYNSAVITAQNCLKKYPDTIHREELSFLILRAKFIQADRSVIDKQAERYRDTIDEYYSFINDYPVSSFKSDADKILAKSEKGLAEVEKLLPPSTDDMDYYKNYGQRQIRSVRNINED